LTTKPLSSFVTKNQQLAIKAWKHRTQLIYYALLATQDTRYKAYKSVEGQMVYVEADEYKNVVRSYAPTTDEVSRISLLATKVWQHVQAVDFPDISKYPEGIDGILQFEEDLLNDKV
jgi:hypothetical protein